MPDIDDLEQVATAVTPIQSLDLEGETVASLLQIVVIGHGTPAVHPIPGRGTLTVGRSPQSDIVINDESISRRHAT